MIKYKNQIHQPGKVIGHETTACKMDDGQKRDGRTEPASVRADTDLADRQHVRARLCGAHPVVAGGRWPDRHLFSYALAQCLPPSAGKRCVSAPEV